MLGLTSRCILFCSSKVVMRRWRTIISTANETTCLRAMNVCPSFGLVVMELTILLVAEFN